MKSPRIRLYQATCRDGDLKFNTQRALRAIGESAGKTDLLVFPETFLQGFPTVANIAELAITVSGDVISSLRNAARQAGISVVIGLAEADGQRFFNTALLIDESGEIRLKYRKCHLYLSDRGVFEPGDDFPVCEWHGMRVGMLICFDIEFPEVARVLALSGADLIVVPDGNMDFSAAVHRQVIPVRALENQLHIVMANRVGQGDNYTFGGESQAADPFGVCLGLASPQTEETLDVVLDMEANIRAKAKVNYLQLAKIALSGGSTVHVIPGVSTPNLGITQSTR
jgi:(R)-amidase